MAVTSPINIKNQDFVPENLAPWSFASPMNFKSQDLLFGKSCSREFAEGSCHPITFTDPASTVLAITLFYKTKYAV